MQTLPSKVQFCHQAVQSKRLATNPGCSTQKVAAMLKVYSCLSWAPQVRDYSSVSVVDAQQYSSTVCCLDVVKACGEGMTHIARSQPDVHAEIPLLKEQKPGDFGQADAMACDRDCSTAWKAEDNGNCMYHSSGATEGSPDSIVWWKDRYDCVPVTSWQRELR